MQLGLFGEPSWNSDPPSRPLRATRTPYGPGNWPCGHYRGSFFVRFRPRPCDSDLHKPRSCGSDQQFGTTRTSTFMRPRPTASCTLDPFVRRSSAYGTEAHPGNVDVGLRLRIAPETALPVDSGAFVSWDSGSRRGTRAHRRRIGGTRAHEWWDSGSRRGGHVRPSAMRGPRLPIRAVCGHRVDRVWKTLFLARTARPSILTGAGPSPSMAS